MAQTMAVLAGVDFSAASDVAVAHAAWEAQRRALPLRLVHGVVPPDVFIVGLPTPSPDPDGMVAAAAQRLATTAGQVRAIHPGLDVQTSVVIGSGALALLEESSTAALAVVGARGQGGFTRLLLGSVASQVSVHAQCPVVVVRAPVGTSPHTPALAPMPGPVVVGVDGSADCGPALDFAFDEATARRVALVAVHVWSMPATGNLDADAAWSRDPARAGEQMEEGAQRVLAEELAGRQEQNPTVVIQRWTVHDVEPAKTLLEIAEKVGAGLVVVGSRGRGDLAGLLLGSVGQRVVGRADRPVAVVHAH